MNTERHDLRLKLHKRLSAADSNRLYAAIMGASTPQGAADAFGCTLRALRYYANLEGFASLLRPTEPPRHSMEHLSQHDRTRLIAAVHRGASCCEMARIAGLTRQAISLWLKRAGLRETWRAKRAEIRREEAKARFARVADHDATPHLMAAATLLAAEGMTVQCIPVIHPERCVGVPTRLYANDRLVRFATATQFRPDLPYLRWHAHDHAAIYVVTAGDRWYIYVPPYPPGGSIYLNPERAIAHRRPESVPALIVDAA